ncbi:MAG: MBOAT family protein [Lachnospiraceae bacterium]|nr:MBOAT family protein [Lachnospiraceae bacterium]
MLFNSIEFLIFFPVTVTVYFLIPDRIKYIWLLAASYFFYMQWNPAYVFLLLTSTVVTYSGALILEKSDDDKKRKLCLFIAILINLTILGYFKYSGLIMHYLYRGFSLAGIPFKPWDRDILLPVGISFFTLQALGYLIDVYRRDIYAERNILKYALFISFFPQLVAGPIERSKNLLKQLATPHRFSYENLRRGLLVMLYGFFLKVVIADRIAIVVDEVYGDPASYPGFYIVFATLLFTLQIYCDFYGYSTIAKGAALTLGVRLMDNFNAPYYSGSIREFWRRWHISLSTWFRDYLYIPLGGNRKGRIRQYINLMIVFAVSGLWHGASVSFIVWGLLHGFYQVMGGIVKSVRTQVLKAAAKEDNEDSASFSDRMLRLVVTFVLVVFAWLFFRANSMSNARNLLIHMTSTFNFTVLFDKSIYRLGVSQDYFNILFISICLLAIVDRMKYKGKDVVEGFFRQRWWFRALAEVGLLLFILLYGCYGSAYDMQQFIYFQF